MIGSRNCPITGVRLQQLSDYNFVDWLLANTAVCAPITFEEIVMIAINSVMFYTLSWKIATIIVKNLPDLSCSGISAKFSIEFQENVSCSSS